MTTNEITYHNAESLNLVSLERPACERGTFPRFIVCVDGDRLECKTLRSLNSLLGSIYSARPRVFVNGGKGLTIDFS